MEQFFVSYLIESLIGAAIFYLLFLIMLKNTTNYQFNRIYLLTASVFSTTLPLLNFESNPVKNSFPELNIFSYSNFVSENIIISQSTSTQTTLQPSSFVLSIPDVVLGIYILVATVLLIKFIVGLLQLFYLYKKNPVQKKANYTLIYLEKEYSPFSFLKYIFINHRYNNEEYFNTIIEHEKVHVFKKHSLDITLLELISIVQWYNPFIWLIKKNIKELHEFQADEKVIAQGFDSNSYFSFLLNKIVGIQAMDFANCFNKSLIKKRIIMMEKSKSKKTHLFKSLLVIPISLLLIAFTIDFNSGTTLKEKPTLSDFQTTEHDKIPEGWFKAGKNPFNYSITVQKDGDEEFIAISSEDAGENGFGNLMQTFSAENYLNKRIRFSGKIRTEDAKFGAMLWMRVDGVEKMKSLAFDNMQGREPKGTTAWTSYDVVLDVPENAVAINIGMMLINEGKAFFKNLNFEEVDPSTPTTDLAPRSFPDKPLNLDLKK